MGNEFYSAYLAAASEYGVAPTEMTEGMELAKATFTEYSKINRDHAITIRLSGEDLERLDKLCKLTHTSKTQVIVKLIYCAAECMPEPPKGNPVAKRFRRKVIVRTEWSSSPTSPRKPDK